MSRQPDFDEHITRQVLLVRAFETGPETTALWSSEDRAWATRVARESLSAGASPSQALAERCRHVLHRLLPREPAAQRALAWRGWNGAWLPLAALAGGLIGLAIDAIGSGQTINLLAPPVWGVVLWNLLVYVFLLLSMLIPSRLGLLATGKQVRDQANNQANKQASKQASKQAGKQAGTASDLRGLRGLRGWLARQTANAGTSIRAKTSASQAGSAASSSASALSRYAQAWAQHGAPLGAARAALLLHAAAAALALGLVMGLYTRGLVLDYRAGWQSTFLDAPQVHTVLGTLLAPAVAVSGIAVPDEAALQALRVAPGQVAAGHAAPWIHLYATLLALFVVLPRLLLAALAGGRARHLSQHIRLPLQEPYFQRLLRGIQGGTAVVQVLPQGAAPSPVATLALQAWLRAALGDNAVLHFAPATAYGQEDQAAQQPAPAGTTLRLVLVDLSSTPEPDTHGRFVQGLQAATPTLPLLLLADETAMQQRFAHLPERMTQRRAAWQALGTGLGTGFVAVNLQQPDLGQAESALNAAQTAIHSPAPSAAAAATLASGPVGAQRD